MFMLHLEKQLGEHQHLLVAYSGGLDSTVLLHQLVCLRRLIPALHLRAIHIHHGLNPLADSWVAHCQQRCAEWQVSLDVVHVQICGREKGIEAAARAARYEAFLQHLKQNEVLLTAQHQDDQCETFLLALKRGSGPAGLSAMPVLSQLGRHCHLRPLLGYTRVQLESWASEHQLLWIEDDSNLDQRYDRNFLRQSVMPLFTTRWPHFSQAVARSASLCAEQEMLLDELLTESLNVLMDQQGTLAIAPLEEMSDFRRSALLRRWIASHQGLMPSRDSLIRIWKEVACSRQDAEPRLLLGKHEIRRYRNRLYWLEMCKPLHDVVIEWPVSKISVTLTEGVGCLTRKGHNNTIERKNFDKPDPSGKSVIIRPPREEENVTVRFHAHGKFHIVGRAGSRSLKKIWQESGVPPWQRERIPMIFYNEHLIAAVGVFVTREGDPGMVGPVWKVCLL